MRHPGRSQAESRDRDLDAFQRYWIKCNRASRDARLSTGYRASRDARLSTGYGISGLTILPMAYFSRLSSALIRAF